MNLLLRSADALANASSGRGADTALRRSAKRPYRPSGARRLNVRSAPVLPFRGIVMRHLTIAGAQLRSDNLRLAVESSESNLIGEVPVERSPRPRSRRPRCCRRSQMRSARSAPSVRRAHGSTARIAMRFSAQAIRRRPETAASPSTCWPPRRLGARGRVGYVLVRRRRDTRPLHRREYLGREDARGRAGPIASVASIAQSLAVTPVAPPEPLAELAEAPSATPPPSLLPAPSDPLQTA